MGDSSEIEDMIEDFDDDDDEDIIPDELMCTPPELLAQANEARNKVIPEKSKSRYEAAYAKFKRWQHSKAVDEKYSENILLAYFNETSASKKPTTMWAMYSMLRAMINLKNKINISSYPNLIGFLKTKSKGYRYSKQGVGIYE